jgi:hypothetical protein
MFLGRLRTNFNGHQSGKSCAKFAKRKKTGRVGFITHLQYRGRNPCGFAILDLRIDVDHDVRSLSAEIYKAPGGGHHRLAAMGIRALLEQVMVIKVCDHGYFGENLGAFCEKGFILRIQRDVLSTVLDLGHAVEMCIRCLYCWRTTVDA